MASIKQNDFVQGQVRNSLRCIDSSENSSGESQLQKFIQGATPDQGRPRTCPGAIQDGDFWQVEFDLTGANPRNSKTQHCADSGFCANDAFQFHMTAQRPGPYNFPYNPDTMNRYTQDGTPGGKDLLQCSVTVHRQLDTFFNIAVFDNMGTQKGTAALSAFSTAGPPVRVKGLPADLLFNRAGAFEADGGGTIFRYNSTFGLVWFGDAKGTSRDFQPGGEYCSVIGSGTTQQPVQDLKCYFPCPAA
ncbi:MAG: hypothetical protein L6R37_005567 [Teloschistes peruensis]|nr:MAG: hypothetical protein L6R37_005567 [Teloschistes peruensis]